MASISTTSSATITTTTTTTTTDHQCQLPVVIVGAGPCGLVAALALRKHGVPFKIIERASRFTICSNAGSGFELAPTAVEILENRLGIDVSKIISYYRGMTILTIEGKTVRHSPLPVDYESGSVNRAEMQSHLLDLLFPSPIDEEGVLFCGSGLETYSEEGEERVVATLASGVTISGCVLLACDGIHSRCRAILHGGYDSHKDKETNAQTGNARDPLHFCNAMVYWGKTSCPKGSDLEREFAKTQMATGTDGNNDKDNGTSFVIALTTPRAPASFFVVPSKNGTMLNWAVSIRAEDHRTSTNNDGTDLTRRGGGPLTESEKKHLFDFQGARRNLRRKKNRDNSESLVRGIRDFPLLELLIERTPAKDITEAGLFDRENLDLPYSSDSKLVALLGDAAHPQTPFLGQGVNMAITDAYVYATNIAAALKTNKINTTISISNHNSLRAAIGDCDTDRRRKQSRKIVLEARMVGNITTSRNRLCTGMTWLYSRFASSREFMSQFVRIDKSNQDYLEVAVSDL